MRKMTKHFRGQSGEKGSAKMHTVRTARAAMFATAAAIATAFPANAIAQTVPRQGSPTASPENKEDLDGDIIVTARKRAERLQDVPVPVSVLDAGALTERNKTRLQDYFSDLPGISIQPGPQSHQTVVIRGLTTSTGNPSVGITVDDVPYGASSNAGGSSQVPDFDPGDIKQIEVLRGPQGTLYGASSLSGLLKYETIAPSTDRLSGRISGGLAAIRHGDGVGYNGRAAINIPVSDDMAVRASGFYRKDAGYIDNPLYGQRGINFDRAHGGRLAALWRPAPDWSLRLSALYQSVKGGATNDEHLDLGDQKQAYLPGSGAYRNQLQAYSAHLAGRIGSVDLTSITGYNVNKVDDRFDLSFALGSLAKPAFGVDGFVVGDDFTNKKFSQELRAETSLGDHVDLQVGGFYTSERGHFVQPLFAADPSTGEEVGLAALQDPHATYREYAAFGSATFKANDRIDVQFGGRESWIRQSYERIDTGPIVGALDGSTNPFVIPKGVSSADVFTFAVTPRFRVNDHLMTYGRAASGYRAGGVNSAFDVPPTYRPDRTYNYEVGLKGDLLERAVTFDLSLYYIDWDDIQLSLQTANFQGYTGNGSKAKSQGVELSVDTHPVKEMTIGGWIEINDAELTQKLPSAGTAVGSPGDRLPYSSPFSGNVHADYRFALSESVSANVGGQMNYVGKRRGTFTGGGDRDVLPDYAVASLSAGLEYDNTWAINLYANNVLNSRGQLAPGFPSANSFIKRSLATSSYRVRPREVGMTLSKKF